MLVALFQKAHLNSNRSSHGFSPVFPAVEMLWIRLYHCAINALIPSCRWKFLLILVKPRECLHTVLLHILLIFTKSMLGWWHDIWMLALTKENKNHFSLQCFSPSESIIAWFRKPDSPATFVSVKLRVIPNNSPGWHCCNCC